MHSFYGFYTAHQVLCESKRFMRAKDVSSMAGPLYELFYWRFMTDQGIQCNMLFDREYSFRSYMAVSLK